MSGVGFGVEGFGLGLHGFIESEGLGLGVCFKVQARKASDVSAVISQRANNLLVGI